MESAFSCLTRLRKIIENAGESPFDVKTSDRIRAEYGNEEFELKTLTDSLIAESSKTGPVSSNPFLPSIQEYCRWIGYDSDTAYVFLFRDTLLPFVCFKSIGRKNLHPWLISRKFIEDITATEYFDDELRAPLYDALESGYTDFSNFKMYCS